MSTSTVRQSRRESLVGKSWVQVAALVAIVGLFVLVLMGWMSYQSHPPIPQRVARLVGLSLAQAGAETRTNGAANRHRSELFN